MDRVSRRGFLARSSAFAAAALAAGPVTVRTAHAATPSAGQLAMTAVAPNPRGNFDKLFVLHGDPLAGPIREVLAEDGALEPARVLPEGQRHVLRLMHFNDMHNHMTDMHKSKGDTHRLAQMVQMVNTAKAARADNESLLFLSGGDDHTGSIFDELLGWNADEFVMDSGYRAASAAGVDVAVLGNHEFDRGAAQLRIGLDADARFPVLSANVHGSAHLKRDRDYTAALVGEVNGLRVGIIGLTTAVDTRTGMDSDPDMAVASPVEAASNIYKAVEAVSDVVIVLSHCGYGKGEHRSGKAGSLRRIGEGDFAIAEALGPLSEKPVVLVGGHSHTELNTDGIDQDNMVAGILLTQAKANGQFLGEIAMSVAKGAGRDSWFSSVSLHPVKSRDDRVKPGGEGYDALEHDGDFDAAFEAEVIAPMIAALDEKLEEVIATVTDATLVSPARTRDDRYVGECALANFMNDLLVARSARSFPGGGVDFALFNASGIITGIEQGPLTFRAWYDVMPYADAVDVATVTGAQIRDMLNSNAQRLLRAEEVAQTDLTGFVSRGFLHFSSGIRYSILPGASAETARAIDIMLHGQPIDEVLDKEFTMGFNTYVALGAFGEAWNGKPIGAGVPGNIPGYDVRSLPWNHTGLVYRNEVIAALRELGEVSPATGVVLDGRLSIASAGN